MNIRRFAPELESKDGIYFAKGKSSISYPDQGNSLCYQIEENSFWFKHRNKCIKALIKRFEFASPFFDVGGGNGFVSKAIQDGGCEAVLVEPGISGARNAALRGVQNVICSTLQDAGFNESSIPSAGLFDVIEHIENDVEFLQMIHKYLDQDGKLMITVPALPFLWSSDDTATGHFRRYTLKSLEQSLSKSGFRLKYASYFFMPLPLPVLFFRSIPSRLGFNKRPINQEKMQNEHQSSASSFLENYWEWEVGRISRLQKISIGSSIIAVAEKR